MMKQNFRAFLLAAILIIPFGINAQTWNFGVDGGLSFAINAKWHHIGLKAEYDLGLATASYYGNGKQRCLSASIIYWLY